MNEEIEQDENEAETAKEILHMVSNSVHDYAIICMDRLGIVTLWSRGAEEIFGWTSDEAVGRTADIIFTPEDRAANQPEKEMATALRDGKAPDERFHITKSGSRLFCSGLMMVMRDHNKVVRGLVKIVRDVTHIRSIEKVQRDRIALNNLLDAQEAERRRFSRDLHDELGQEITALRLHLKSLQLKYAENEELTQELEKAKEFARTLDRGIDHLAWEIRPAILETMSLPKAIEQYAKHWGDYFGIDTSVMGGDAKDRYLPEIEAHIFRVVQEALNNIAKHAEATVVSIVMTQRNETLQMVIEDNGKGFIAEEAPSSGRTMGLTGMNERAVLMGGSLQIESSPNKGTTIFLTVPIPAT